MGANGRGLPYGLSRGFIFMSDHSVTSAVSGATYDFIVKLVRKYGRYPLRLGEYDLPDIR